MVRFLSVDWLAQSHSCEGKPDGTFKPHVPCMVQPSAPSYGKGYLQPKPKSARNTEETVEPSVHSGPGSPRSSCASPVSETSEYSSGYESEAASSECSASDDVSEVEKDAQSQRRARTKFTPEQIHKLEKIFLKHKYLEAGERVKTAQRLRLTETQVRTWFQNRRMKLKREVQDYLTPQAPPLLLPPPLHYHRPPYPHPYPGTTGAAPAPGYYPGTAHQFPQLLSGPAPYLHQQQQHHQHQHFQSMMMQHQHFY